MVFVYIKIYYAARERARRVINKPGFGKRISRRFAKNPTTSTAAASAGVKSGPPPPASMAAGTAPKSIGGPTCNNDASRNQQPISTISNNNGMVRINSSANNTTIAEPEAVEATVESKPTVIKKRARFDLDPTTTPAENENLLPPPAASNQEAASVKKKSVHILSATTSSSASMASTGRVSDPCEVTILDRPHAYGACAQNGGQPKPPRTCRSVGVSTKDDSVINNSSSSSSTSNRNRGCVPPSNGTTETSSSASSSTANSAAQGLRSRLKLKFKNGVSGVSSSGGRRRPSKETREVIDMGKLSNATGNNLACKKKSPLNGILRKKSGNNVNADATSNTGGGGCNSVATTGGGCSITNQVSVGPNSTAASEVNTLPNNNPPLPKLTPEQEAEKEKKRMARKKERRATLILGLIMGSFIACWFPFFFLYSISPWCPICDGSNGPICVQSWGFTLAFWLGYSNSALNPVIYTVFNKDFRRAFKRILFK